ncbi:MAG: hypothetical protein KatS3mg103_0184 [Phycisphaerales bacterium]|nr:MAG: hypothetical protein KatS3mg103_0184 [Phycisphaerales bacterium]
METTPRQPRAWLRELPGRLRSLGTLEKLLVGCVVVIVSMAFFLVSQYAGRPSVVAAATIEDPADQARAIQFLKGQGIEARAGAAGELLVPSDQATMAQAVLLEQRLVPMQTATFFEQLVQSRSWMNSRQDNHQQFWALYSQHLSELLSHWRTIRRAQVLIDMPEQSGLARAHRSPTASVMVWPVGGVLPQETVDAIAMGVAGAVSGLEPQNVSITDGASGLWYTPQLGQALNVRGVLEHKLAVEEMIEGKLREFLRDIPGMSLAVLARVDHARKTAQSQTFERPVSGIVSEQRTEQTQQSAVRGGVPGTRSNESMSISQGSSEGTTYSETTEESRFENRFGNTTENVEDPGGHLQGVSVLLGVPRSYVRRLIELEREPPAEGQEPQPVTSADIAQRFDLVRNELENRIQLALGNIVVGDPADVAVTVSMLSDLAGTGGGAGGVGPGGGGGFGGPTGWLGLAGGGLVDKAVLAVLAVVSLAMMALLVRKATKRVELPTAEELVGIPPALQADGDVFGEADEGDVAMSGIELDEEQVRSAKMLEQVGELVSKSPQTAAQLLQGWIAADEQ